MKRWQFSRHGHGVLTVEVMDSSSVQEELDRFLWDDTVLPGDKIIIERVDAPGHVRVSLRNATGVQIGNNTVQVNTFM